MNPTYSSVKKDTFYNSLSTTSNNKIPRYSTLSSLGDDPGQVGNIAFVGGTNKFYGHTNTEWAPFGGPDIITVLTSTPIIGDGSPADPVTIGQFGAVEGQTLAWSDQEGAWFPEIEAEHTGNGGAGTILDPNIQMTFINPELESPMTTGGVAQWWTRLAGTGSDIGKSISITPDGDVYCTGQYASSPLNIYNFGGTTAGTLPRTGSNDVFIVKYNSSGVAQWWTRLAGSASDIGNGISVASEGDVHCIGQYVSTPLTIYNFGGSIAGTLLHDGTLTIINTFVVKYNSFGIAQWWTRITGTSHVTGRNISVDQQGNVYCIGEFKSDALIYNFGGDIAATLLNSGDTDIYIIKYNSSGIAQWWTRLAPADDGTLLDLLVDISVTPLGDVYCSGYYSTNTLYIYNFGGTIAGSLLNSGVVTSFIIKYNSMGIAQWWINIINNVQTEAFGINASPEGDVYITGDYDVDPLNIYNFGGSLAGTLSNSGGFDSFIIKYNSSGWAQWWTRVANVGDDTGHSISVNSIGDVFCVGNYDSDSDPIYIYNFGGATAGSLSNGGSFDTYLIKYNSSGIAQWWTRISGTGNNLGFDVSANTIGDVLCIGQYAGILNIYNFDESLAGTLPNSGSNDVFIVKYNSNPLLNFTLPPADLDGKSKTIVLRGEATATITATTSFDGSSAVKMIDGQDIQLVWDDGESPGVWRIISRNYELLL